MHAAPEADYATQVLYCQIKALMPQNGHQGVRGVRVRGIRGVRVRGIRGVRVRGVRGVCQRE